MKLIIIDTQHIYNKIHYKLYFPDLQQVVGLSIINYYCN